MSMKDDVKRMLSDPEKLKNDFDSSTVNMSVGQLKQCLKTLKSPLIRVTMKRDEYERTRKIFLDLIEKKKKEGELDG